MKDTVISSATKKRELMILLICFLAAVLFNIISILVYKTPWKELFTQLHVVLLVGLFFYAVSGLIRLLIVLTLKATRKQQ